MHYNTLADGDSMDMKYVCKQCGNELQEDDLFCPYCGHKAEIVIPQPEDSVFCAECGAKNGVGESFCFSCGAKLNIDQAEPKKEVESNNPVDLYDDAHDHSVEVARENNTSIHVGNTSSLNQLKSKALFEKHTKDTPPKRGIILLEPEKRQDEVTDTSTVDPYDDWMDEEEVDPFDEWMDEEEIDTYDEHEESLDNKAYSSDKVYSSAKKWVFAICIVIFLVIIWPDISGYIRSYFTPISSKRATETQNNSHVEGERLFVSETMRPTSTPSPTATTTPVITAVPTAIPVGSVSIDITPAKLENGAMVVAYEDDLRLSWHANNAYYYDVSLQGAAGNVIVRGTNTTETHLDIASGYLSTGSYVIFVTAYNSSGIAGSTEKLWFDIASTNTHIELSDYLGTSLYSFAHSIGGMRDVSATDGVEYSNGTVMAYSPFDLDCITFIGLERASNYSICGVSVGQSLKEASNTLSDAGWWIIDQRDTSRDYQDSEGNTIFIWSENGNTVDSISIYLSDDTLADMYPSYFDYDDDWGTYTEDIEMVYTTGDVNIRKGPGKDYGSAGVIKADTVVTYLGNSSVDERGVVWYNILYNGINGWVSSKYAELLY